MVSQVTPGKLGRPMHHAGICSLDKIKDKYKMKNRRYTANIIVNFLLTIHNIGIIISNLLYLLNIRLTLRIGPWII